VSGGRSGSAPTGQPTRSSSARASGEMNLATIGSAIVNAAPWISGPGRVPVRRR